MLKYYSLKKFVICILNTIIDVDKILSNKDLALYEFNCTISYLRMFNKQKSNKDDINKIRVGFIPQPQQKKHNYMLQIRVNMLTKSFNVKVLHKKHLDICSYTYNIKF